MQPRPAFLAVLVLVSRGAAAQSTDAAMQNLLTGLTHEMRDGPQRLPGVLPLTGEAPMLSTEVLVAGAQVPPPAPAAAGTAVPYSTR